MGEPQEFQARRRETGKEYGVKVSDDKDLASHIGPKPCVGAREGDSEASVGECTGRPLSPEKLLLGADKLVTMEGNTAVFVIARALLSRRGRRTRHVQTFLAREPGYLGFGQGCGCWSASGRRSATSR